MKWNYKVYQEGILPMKKEAETIRKVRFLLGCMISIIFAVLLCTGLLVWEFHNRKHPITIGVFFFIIFILCIMIVMAVYHYQRHIVYSYKKLYHGMFELGLVNEGNKQKSNNHKSAALHTDIDEMFHRINDILRLIENMNNNSSFTEMLDFINNTFSPFIPYNYIGVALLEKEETVIKAAYGVSDGTVLGLPENLIGKSVILKETSLNTIIDHGNARIINDLEEYTKGKPLKLYNKIILEAGIRSSITLPLKVAEKPVGVIFFSSYHKNVYKEEHIKFLKMLVNSIAISFKQNIFINDLFYSNTLALAKLAEARDEDTGEHLERMKYYSVKIAELLLRNEIYKEEITLEFIDNIERFSPLHDIGKVGVPDGILLKPEKLTEEEYEQMKKHTVYGADVLRAAEETIGKHKKSLFVMGIEIAEGHQEKWDGSGYPFGRKGKEIPLSARIVAVADVFDALTSKRPYKNAFSFEKSFQMIVEESGTHFDPVIVTCFKNNKEVILRMYRKFHDEVNI